MVSGKASDKLGNNQAVNARKFLAELKRRDVFKVAVAYIVAGWALG